MASVDLPLSRTHSLTHKCKISIMITIFATDDLKDQIETETETLYMLKLCGSLCQS